jgi:hypothetical protein
MALRVITFDCSDYIHVYTEKSPVRPNPPYKTHSSIDNAIEYLKKTRSVSEPKVVEK